MTSQSGGNIRCLVVGEYVDEAEIPANITCSRGETVRTHLVANYLDLWGQGDELKEFTILLKDKGSIFVHGHGLKLIPPTPSEPFSHYSVIVRAGEEEVIVALFKSLEVAGIFSGEMRTQPNIA